MTEPHLLPNQIDRLVDDDAGADAPRLWEHLATCDDCRARYDSARRAADAVAAIPHFTPRLPFADHVMARVHVTEPWHAALAEDARRMVPTSGPVRSVAAAGAILTGLLLTALALWLVLRWDLASWMLQLGVERGRAVASAGAVTIATEAFGGSAVRALANGDRWPVTTAAAVLVSTSVVSALGFRRLAAASHAKRG